MNKLSWPESLGPATRDILNEVLDAATDSLPPETRSTAGIEISAEPGSGVPVLSGELSDWDDVVKAGHAAASRWMSLRENNPSDIVVDITVSGYTTPQPADHTQLHTGDLPASADVVIVGAGIAGLMVAHSLARAGLQVLVVDAALHLGAMTTSWNNGMVHPGHDSDPGSLKSMLNVEGNLAWQPLMASLGLEFERRPSLVACFKAADDDRLDALLKRAKTNRVPGAALISGSEARKIEPRLTHEIRGALYCPTTASIDPVLVCQALAREVRARGGLVKVATPVSEIVVENGVVQGVRIGQKHVTAPLVVNAAGVQADALAATAGSRRYSIHPRRGSLLIFDPGFSDRYLTSVHPIPAQHSKGAGMTARPDGLTTGGPTAVEQQSKSAEPPSQAEIDQILETSRMIYPDFPSESIVSVGSAVRAPAYCEDFVIGPAPGIVGLVDVAGTQSPAIASAPAIAARVMKQLAHLGRIPTI